MFVAGGTIRPIDFGGLRIFDYTSGHDLSSSLAVIDVPPGAAHAVAWSKRSDKYYLVIEGALRFMIDDTETDLATGDFCLVRQGRRFSYSNPTSTLSRLVLVHTPNFDLSEEVFVETAK
ncbi:MAG: cupin domain-containing protein [Thermodesulfobacteriota bacterium]